MVTRAAAQTKNRAAQFTFRILNSSTSQKYRDADFARGALVYPLSDVSQRQSVPILKGSHVRTQKALVALASLFVFGGGCEARLDPGHHHFFANPRIGPLRRASCVAAIRIDPRPFRRAARL